MRLLLAIITLSLVAIGSAYAQAGRDVQSKLNQAESFREAGDLEKAKSVVLAALKGAPAGKRDWTYLERALGYLYYEAGQLSLAEKALSSAFETGLLASEIQNTLALDLARLSYNNGRYSRVLNLLEGREYKQLEAQVLFAAASVHTGVLAKAEPITEKLLTSREASAQSYNLLAWAYYENNYYAKCIRLVEAAMDRFPSEKHYWQLLASAYEQQNKFAEAFSVLEAAELKGLLNTEPERLHLIHSALQAGASHLAARKLDDYLNRDLVKHSGKSFELLAHAWLASRDLKSAAAAFTKAAELSGKGKLWLQAGQIHIDLEDWQSALGALRKADASSNLASKSQAKMLLGYTYFQLGKFKDAQKVFKQAALSDSDSQRAKQWLKYLAQQSPELT